jgi:hypothetical protein
VWTNTGALEIPVASAPPSKTRQRPPLATPARTGSVAGFDAIQGRDGRLSGTLQMGVEITDERERYDRAVVNMSVQRWFGRACQNSTEKPLSLIEVSDQSVAGWLGPRLAAQPFSVGVRLGGLGILRSGDPAVR